MIQICTAIFAQKLSNLLYLIIGVLGGGGEMWVRRGKKGLNKWIQGKIIEIP